MRLESSLQKQLVKYLKELEVYYVKIITAGSGGNPDYLCCHKGRFIGIECKSDTGTQSPLQKYKQSIIEKNGGLYILARSIQDVREVLK